MLTRLLQCFKPAWKILKGQSEGITFTLSFFKVFRCRSDSGLGFNCESELSGNKTLPNGSHMIFSLKEDMIFSL